MTRFVNLQVTREAHPTIGHAIVAELNTYQTVVQVMGIVYHPPNPQCTWREDRGEMAEVILELEA